MPLSGILNQYCLVAVLVSWALRKGLQAAPVTPTAALSSGFLTPTPLLFHYVAIHLLSQCVHSRLAAVVRHKQAKQRVSAVELKHKVWPTCLIVAHKVWPTCLTVVKAHYMHAWCLVLACNSIHRGVVPTHLEVQLQVVQEH